MEMGDPEQDRPVLVDSRQAGTAVLNPDRIGERATRPQREEIEVRMTTTPARRGPLQARLDLRPAALVRSPPPIDGAIGGL